MGHNSPDHAISAIGAALAWVQGALLGSVATTAAIIAVASIGFLMLSGRLDVRRAAQVVLGCFIVFGASTAAGGLQLLVQGSTVAAAAPPAVTPPPPAPQSAPAAAYDPYAGAALVTQ